MRRSRLALLAAVLGALALLWWLGSEESPAPAVPTATVDPAQRGGEAAAGTPAPTAPSPPPVREVALASGRRVRLIERPPLPRPDPPYGPAYAALIEAAEAGVAEAQYQLGLLLYQCRRIPEQAEALAAQIDRLQQTREYRGFPVERPDAEAAQWQQGFEDCRGVPAAARGEYRRWLRQAADQGLIEAQLDLMFHLPDIEYCQYLHQCSPEQRVRQQALQQEALADVERARAAGSVSALWTFGGWYLGEEVLPSDPIEAYAHFLALDQIQAAAGRERRFTAMLEGLQGRLRPVDRTQAEARAEALLANPACCVLTD